MATKEHTLGRIPSFVLARSGHQGAHAQPDPLRRSRSLRTRLEKIDPSFFYTTPPSRSASSPGSSVLPQSDTVLLLKVHKNEEKGEVLNLVMAWAVEGMQVSLDVSVMFKRVGDFPGLKKAKLELHFLLETMNREVVLFKALSINSPRENKSSDHPKDHRILQHPIAGDYAYPLHPPSLI